MNSTNTLHSNWQNLQLAGTYIVICGTRLPLWQTALLIGLLLSLLQNIGHLIPNPIILLNSVRISHMIETSLSTLVFGLVVAWLLYPNYINRKP